MKYDPKEVETFTKLLKDLKGVISYQDLVYLYPNLNKKILYSKIKNYEKLGLVRRFVKGLYVSSLFDFELLTVKLEPQSYISFESVLRENGLIGSGDNKFIRSVYPGRSKFITSDSYGVSYFHSGVMSFNGVIKTNGVWKATKEKAYLDILYFYQKGKKFYINPLTDIDKELLNKKMIIKLLKDYKNPKFKLFVKNEVVNEI